MEAEPAEPTCAAETVLDAFDEAEAELEKANKEVNRLLAVYGDSEFDSQWCQPGFVMRVKERLAAAESKLLQATRRPRTWRRSLRPTAPLRTS